MQKMYPGKINSPRTNLVIGIDNSQTSFDVVDASVLPSAPNILTIGIESLTPETILYTNITGNTISGCTRAFQGTAQSWSTSNYIARTFTEYDYSAMTSNIIEADANAIAYSIALG